MRSTLVLSIGVGHTTISYMSRVVGQRSYDYQTSSRGLRRIPTNLHKNSDLKSRINKLGLELRSGGEEDGDLWSSVDSFPILFSCFCAGASSFLIITNFFSTWPDRVRCITHYTQPQNNQLTLLTAVFRCTLTIPFPRTLRTCVQVCVCVSRRYVHYYTCTHVPFKTHAYIHHNTHHTCTHKYFSTVITTLWFHLLIFYQASSHSVHMQTTNISNFQTLL